LKEYEEKKIAFSKSKKRRIFNNSPQQSQLAVVRDEHRSISKSEKLILQFIVKGMHPLSTIEQPEFCDLIKGDFKIIFSIEKFKSKPLFYLKLGLDPEIRLMSRRTLSRRIDGRFDDMQRSTILTLKVIDYVCITADAWTMKGMSRSFLGVTAHWVLT